MYLTLLALILISIWGVILDFNLKNAQTKLIKTTIEKNVTNPIKIFYSQPTSSNNNIDEITKVLIGLCHMNQAQIIICQECYESGKTYCPYPTDAFCEQARNADPDDPSIAWNFLPGSLGSTGYINSLENQPEKNPNDIQSLNDLGEAEIYRLNKVFQYNFYDPNLKYTKPNTKKGEDPCAVDGIVHY